REPLELTGLVLVGDLQQWDLALVAAFGECVDTDDEPSPAVESAFEVVCGVGNAPLEPVLLDPLDHTFEHRAVTEFVEVREELLRLPFDLVGEVLDVPRASERVWGSGNGGVVCECPMR